MVKLAIGDIIMRATVAKRLRRLVAISGRPANHSMLVHSERKKQYWTAVLAPGCGRYRYQQLKKEYMTRGQI